MEWHNSSPRKHEITRNSLKSQRHLGSIDSHVTNAYMKITSNMKRCKKRNTSTKTEANNLRLGSNLKPKQFLSHTECNKKKIRTNKLSSEKDSVLKKYKKTWETLALKEKKCFCLRVSVPQPCSDRIQPFKLIYCSLQRRTRRFAVDQSVMRSLHEKYALFCC